MPLFRKKKQAAKGGLVLTELDEILAYLDELVRRRVPLTYVINKKSYQTDILFLESKNKAIRIQSGGTSRLPHGADATVGFALDKTWWSFKSKFVIIDDKPYLLIPKVIEHNERRKSPRCGFSPREQVKITILEGLGSGSGVFGLAKDISTDGMSMVIEKAMHLATEKEVVPSPTLFQPGTKLAMVKINRIPTAPLLEISGVAKRVYRDGKWMFAFQFAGLSKSQEQMITRFIVPRVLEFKATRRSFKKRQEMEAEKSTGGGGASSAGSSGARRPPGATQESAAAKPEPAVEKAKVLVVGDLVTELAFLAKPDSPFEVLPGTSPVGIIKVLTESQPKLMLCGVEFKGRSMVEVLEKISNMGVSKGTRIVICATELPSKDRIKFKMLKIENLIEPPAAGDEASFVDKLKTYIG